MFLRYNFYTAVWFLLIASLVLLPGQNMPSLGSSIVSIDKVIHASLFVGLFFLMAVGFSKQRTYAILHNKALQYSFIITLAYAVSIEAVQILSDGRSFEIGDMIANISGCFAGYLLFLVIYK